MKIKIRNLEKLVYKSLRNKYDRRSSKLIADVVMFGELSGKKSHGIVRLIKGNSSMLAQEPTGKPKIINKTRLSKLIESNQNPGMLIGQIAINNVIQIAKKNGFGLVGTKNTFSTSGCLTYYLEKIAKNGLIGIIMPQSPLCMTPFNSIEPLLGTNPISFGFPSKNKPFIFDMGTSAVSWGELLRADAAGEKLPENVAIDEKGNVTLDPKKAMGGALLPFDASHKGSGLSLIVEIFGGLWPGADYGGLNSEGGWGSLYMAYKPDLLMNYEEFELKIKRLIERIRNSKTKDGNKVRIPGERTIKQRNEILKQGWVNVDESLLKGIKEYLEKGKLL